MAAPPTPPISTDALIQPTDDPSPEPPDDSAASTEPSDESSANAAGIGMRVVDRGTTDGLLQTIVGGVTGYFFGG